MYNITELKKYPDKLSQLVCLAMEKAGQGSDYDRATRVEVAFFLLFLAMSDGIIGMDEASEIGSICGIELNRYNIDEYIDGGKIADREFVDRPPLQFQIMVEIDKVLYDIGTNLDCARSMLDVYKYLGSESVRMSGGKAARKMRYVQYIGMMERYMHEELDGNAPLNPIEVNSVNIQLVKSAKNGVLAPKKGL